MAELSRRRTVISLSLSAVNPDACVVAEQLGERGIELTRGGGQILAWAAAYLLGKASEPAVLPTGVGLNDDEIDALLEDF